MSKCPPEGDKRFFSLMAVARFLSGKTTKKEWSSIDTGISSHSNGSPSSSSSSSSMISKIGDEQENDENDENDRHFKKWNKWLSEIALREPFDGWVLETKRWKRKVIAFEYWCNLFFHQQKLRSFTKWKEMRRFFDF